MQDKTREIVFSFYIRILQDKLANHRGNPYDDIQNTADTNHEDIGFRRRCAAAMLPVFSQFVNHFRSKCTSTSQNYKDQPKCKKHLYPSYLRRIFSMDFPLASSSTSLSRYRISSISGLVIVSSFTPQTEPRMNRRLSLGWGAWRKKSP